MNTKTKDDTNPVSSKHFLKSSLSRHIFDAQGYESSDSSSEDEDLTTLPSEECTCWRSKVANLGPREQNYVFE